MEIVKTLEVDVKIKFNVYPGEPQTRNYPGCEPEVELLSVELDDEKTLLNCLEEDLDMGDFLEAAAQEMEEEKFAAAEAKYDEMKEEGLI